jgi:hypothetical protein
MQTYYLTLLEVRHLKWASPGKARHWQIVVLPEGSRKEFTFSPFLATCIPGLMVPSILKPVMAGAVFLTLDHSDIDISASFHI